MTGPKGSKIFLLGANGMLGRAFGRLVGDIDQTMDGRRDLAGLAAREVVARIATSGAAVVLNCAADTDVDAAENEPGRAIGANALLPEAIAHGCRRSGALLVHFSSTGCYGAYRTEPYRETDPLRPTTSHHRSKAMGEQAIRDIGCRHLILRLGWLYGGPGRVQKNFVWNRIVEAQGCVVLESDPTQIGCPTWTDDVVRQTRVLLEAGAEGTFNCVGDGHTSRLGYVEAILAAAALDVELRPRAFVRRAPVSPNESAVNDALDRMGLCVMPPWRQSLERYVRDLRVERGDTLSLDPVRARRRAPFGTPV